MPIKEEVQEKQNLITQCEKSPSIEEIIENLKGKTTDNKKLFNTTQLVKNCFIQDWKYAIKQQKPPQTFDVNVKQFEVKIGNLNIEYKNCMEEANKYRGEDLSVLQNLDLDESNVQYSFNIEDKTMRECIIKSNYQVKIDLLIKNIKIVKGFLSLKKYGIDSIVNITIGKDFYFTGTNSCCLALMLNLDEICKNDKEKNINKIGLKSTGQLLKEGVMPISGELRYTVFINNGVSRRYVSFADIFHIDTSINFAKSKFDFNWEKNELDLNYIDNQCNSKDIRDVYDEFNIKMFVVSWLRYGHDKDSLKKKLQENKVFDEKFKNKMISLCDTLSEYHFNDINKFLITEKFPIVWMGIEQKDTQESNYFYLKQGTNNELANKKEVVELGNDITFGFTKTKYITLVQRLIDNKGLRVRILNLNSLRCLRHFCIKTSHYALRKMRKIALPTKSWTQKL